MVNLDKHIDEVRREVVGDVSVGNVERPLALVNVSEDEARAHNVGEVHVIAAHGEQHEINVRVERIDLRAQPMLALDRDRARAIPVCLTDHVHHDVLIRRRGGSAPRVAPCPLFIDSVV